jgi:hypothetical protein
MRREWPLVGRREELRRLGELLFGERRRGVMLAGPAGVGKTRLALECLERAEQSGMVGLRVTATRAGAGLPLGAMAALLPASGQSEVGGADDRPSSSSTWS